MNRNQTKRPFPSMNSKNDEKKAKLDNSDDEAQSSDVSNDAEPNALFDTLKAQQEDQNNQKSDEAPAGSLEVEKSSEAKKGKAQGKKKQASATEKKSVAKTTAKKSKGKKKEEETPVEPKMAEDDKTENDQEEKEKEVAVDAESLEVEKPDEGKKEATVVPENKSAAKATAKKTKGKKKEEVTKEAENDDETESENEMPKKVPTDAGKFYFDIGRNRRVELTTYNGTQSINIREYYNDGKTGIMKPGKKGITLHENEWNKLMKLGDQFKFDA